MKDFRVAFAKELTGSYASRKRPGRPRHTPASRHFCQALSDPRGRERSTMSLLPQLQESETRDSVVLEGVQRFFCVTTVVMTTVLESTI